MPHAPPMLRNATTTSTKPLRISHQTPIAKQSTTTSNTSLCKHTKASRRTRCSTRPRVSRILISTCTASPMQSQTLPQSPTHICTICRTAMHFPAPLGHPATGALSRLWLCITLHLQIGNSLWPPSMRLLPVKSTPYAASILSMRLYHPHSLELLLYRNLLVS